MPWLISTDQMGNEVELTAPPQRIISLVPSQTELLFDLGLEGRIIGVTKFCVHPQHARKIKTVIGGTKNFQSDTIAALQPDLIIGNKEENYPEGISDLQKKFPVWMSDITTFGDAIRMIHAVSVLTDTVKKGSEIVDEIQQAFSTLKLLPPIKVLYLIWRNPWMAAAGNTFIDTMLGKLGLVNVLHEQDRYPELSVDALIQLHPSLVMLSSEPYPFAEKHIAEIHEILPGTEVQLVDGEIFSWYGSRLKRAPAYVNSLKFGL